MNFKCSICEKDHNIEDISFGADQPLQWALISEKEKEQSELGQEQCIIKSQEGISFYIRARLMIPIKNSEKSFSWGVWCSLSEKSFIEMSDLWENSNRTNYGPYFGWLCTNIPDYPDTINLKTMVHQAPVGLRPFVELEQNEHPLSIHQREGIDKRELKKIIIKLLHQK